MGIGSLLGGMMIADAISKSNNGSNNQQKSGVIRSYSGESWLEKHKKKMASMTPEEREEYLEKEKAYSLYNFLGEERYIKYLKDQEARREISEQIDELGVEEFNARLLLKAKNEEIETLKEENKKLKEEKRPKLYIRKK